MAGSHCITFRLPKQGGFENPISTHGKYFYRNHRFPHFWGSRVKRKLFQFSGLVTLTIISSSGVCPAAFSVADDSSVRDAMTVGCPSPIWQAPSAT